jgi:HK97 family phage prohead protease
MSKRFETKRYAADFKTRADDSEGRGIIGRPVVIGQETDLGCFREIIDPGALDETDLKDVLFFTNHDTQKIPLARSRNNNENSTMHITVDDDGIEVDATLDVENNADARALYSSVGRGDMTGMSFMFTIDAEMWEDEESDSPLRHITKIGQLIEVSAVNFPAYPQTEISVRDKEALESVKRSLESARAAHALDSAGEGETAEQEELAVARLEFEKACVRAQVRRLK